MAHHHEPARRRCPWCPNEEGCSSCSFSGDAAGSYVLISEAEATARTRRRVQWLVVLSCALGGMVVGMAVLLIVVLLGL